jgi:phospholipase C
VGYNVIMKRTSVALTVIAVVAAAVLAIILVASRPRQAVAPQNGGNTAPSSSSSTKSNSKPSLSSTLAHIFVIVEENKPIGNIIGNADAPYINGLAKQYALATNYYAVAHPSLPNYLALTSGSTDGVTNDCAPPSAGCEVDVPNIADEIEKSGRTWKEYAESMPSNCYAKNTGRYATRHNPFEYYTNIINNSARCKAHVVPFSQLEADLRSAQTTPNFAFITPNLCSDMHDCSVATGDNWLAKNVPMIMNSKAFTTQNSLLIITWDEGDSSTNRVAAILAGPGVKQGFESASHYSHYSLLHTIESAWNLPGLTENDKQAPLMSEFFK